MRIFLFYWEKFQFDYLHSFIQTLFLIIIYSFVKNDNLKKFIKKLNIIFCKNRKILRHNFFTVYRSDFQPLNLVFTKACQKVNVRKFFK